jgi:hypothetical protein
LINYNKAKKAVFVGEKTQYNWGKKAQLISYYKRPAEA